MKGNKKLIAEMNKGSSEEMLASSTLNETALNGAISFSVRKPRRVLEKGTLIMTAKHIFGIGIALPLLLLVACTEKKESPPNGAPVQASQPNRGQEVYQQVCAACHDSGLNGAPKLGDREAWSPHISHGLDHMVESAIRGKGAMPARGGQAGLSDNDIKAAVSYMIEKSR